LPAWQWCYMPIAKTRKKNGIDSVDNAMGQDRPVKTTGAYTEWISTGPRLVHTQYISGSTACRFHSLYETYLTNRMSSKYIVPELPAAAAFFVPKPIVIVFTLARFTPVKAVRSITHSVQILVCVAAGSP